MSHKINNMTEKSFKTPDKIAKFVFFLIMCFTIYNLFASGIQWSVAEY